ncbi:HD domain-containing protein [Sulfurovum sp. zt1-1]|uniref:HD domain-containing protein n=1 Tax=Sulfurovum zhangzhouensis TaxID=3019067 RepID=A0ABT7QYH7_9BACT|nr:HD domain-containing protein [Sulfurovum zhangzhouensis]MDM5271894.1 HD domain-containing protein [Sulfurovum zhangzhouensis]
MKLPVILQTISHTLTKFDAKAVIVGGSVRDHFLGLPIKDYDIEVYGLTSMESLEKILSAFGSVNHVGKSFGVLKFSYEGEEYDFALPRREQKVGEGHRGFDVTVDGSMSFEEASRRRDFTINAIGYDIESDHFLDPFGGREDMHKGLIRHIDDKTFVEDPLRVYRAVQFGGRFGYSLAESTKVLCQLMVDSGMLESLPKERIYVEWVKLLLKSHRPSIGFEMMKELGVLRYFPELEALIGVAQDPKYHPEGDVWVHTMMCLDVMAELSAEMDKEQKLKFLFAILCHDLGKATTTTFDDDGRIRSIGHEEAGVELTRSLMYRLSNAHDFIESLMPLVVHHLKPTQLYKANASNKAIRRLATRVNIEELVVIAKADFLGRTTTEAMSGEYKAGEWLLERARELKVECKPLDNLIKGRDLITLGLKPSPQFKEILDEVYELQLADQLTTKEQVMQYVYEKYK